MRRQRDVCDGIWLADGSFGAGTSGASPAVTASMLLLSCTHTLRLDRWVQL